MQGIITQFEKNARDDSKFHDLLIESLKQAQQKGEKNLEPGLYSALHWWPQDLKDYVAYLRWFARWTPRQSTNPAWVDPSSPVGEHQEVYDRLCHFYWLIDQPVGPSRKIVEDVPWFSWFLVSYANLWGEFLNTTQSFSQDVLDSFINESPEYRVQDSMINGQPNSPSGWLTFNQFFARELNPGLRPIDSPAHNTIAVSGADCTYKQAYDIDKNSAIKKIIVKGTHSFANIKELLLGSEYNTEFAGGKFIHYFLGPYSYHRFHAPVAGKVLESRAIHGKVFLDVNLEGNQFDAPDSSQGGYEFYQERGVIIFDTSKSEFGDVGLVAAVPIGMCQVSSVNMTAVEGSTLQKGDEFGYFLFGGSDMILLFQEGRIEDFFHDGSKYLHYGNQVANLKKK